MNNINQMFWNAMNSKSKGKKYKSRFEELYRNSFALDSMNKYDGRFSLPSTTLKTILEENDFATKLQEVGYNLSKHGTGYAFVVWRYDGKSYIDTARLANYSTVMGRLVRAWVDTNDIIEVCSSNGETSEFNLIAYFYYDGTKVMKETGYYNSTNEWVINTEAIEYDTAIIPVLPLHNNPLRTPDLLEEAKPLIKQMEAMYDSIPTEWEKSKILYVFNEWVNSTQTNETFEAKVIEKGESTFSVSDPDNKVANAVAPLSVGTATLQQLEQTIGFLDNRIRELCFQFRDHGSDGRRNELDLMLFNQKAYEYLITKKEFRQRQLQKFIDMLSIIENTPTAALKIQLVEFEEFRAANLKAIADIKVAQAEQARGIAEKNKQEAQALKDQVATPAPQAITSLNISNGGK